MTQDNSVLIESSFLKDLPVEDPFEALCQKCELEWKVQKCKKDNVVKVICVDNGCEKSVFSCGLEKC